MNKSFPRRPDPAIVAPMNGMELDESAAFEDWEQRPLSQRARPQAPYLDGLNPDQRSAVEAGVRLLVTDGPDRAVASELGRSAPIVDDDPVVPLARADRHPDRRRMRRHPRRGRTAR